jgi:hypothetical protein
MKDVKAQQLVDRIATDMRASLLGKKTTEAKTLKSLLAAIHNAEAVTVAEASTINKISYGVGSTEAIRREIDFAGIQIILNQEISEIHAALKIMGEESDYVIELHAMLTVLDRYRTPE